jgi:hypothetical protein
LFVLPNEPGEDPYLRSQMRTKKVEVARRKVEGEDTQSGGAGGGEIERRRELEGERRWKPSSRSA